MGRKIWHSTRDNNQGTNNCR